MKHTCTPSALRRLTACMALAAAAPAGAASADLTALDLEQLLQLTVVGASKYEQKQSEVAAAVSILTRQDIKTFGWHTLDQALASLPGVHTTYDRQYMFVGLRGFGLPGDFNTRVLVTIDGNRVNDAIYDAGPFGHHFPLDMALVERIEFIAGPGSAVYGQNAMFGVVNVVTRSGKEMNGAELAVGLQQPQALRAGRASWGKRLDNGVDVLVSTSTLRSRGEDHFMTFGSADVSGVAKGLDGERDKEFFMRLGRGAWSFEYVFGDRRKDDPVAAYHGDPLTGGQFQADRYALAQLQYEDKLDHDRLRVLGRLFSGRERYSSGAVYDATPYAYIAPSQWHGAELRLLSTRVERHKLMLGVEYQDNVRATQNIINVTDPLAATVIARPGYRAGIYAQDEWRITDALTGILGARRDRNDSDGATTSPRVGLIWQANSATTLKSLAGRAHRAPNAFERGYGNDGSAQVFNPDLHREQIDTLELVADHRATAQLTVRASLYQWTMRDLITEGVDPVSGFAQYQSGGTVKASGVELSADHIWAGGARARGSLSYQDAAYANGAGIVNAPQWLAKLNASSTLPVAGLRAAYELRYDSRRRTVGGADTGGHALSNVVLSTEAPAGGVELSLGIQNVFDKRYAQPGATTNWQNEIVQDGRSVRADLTVRF